MRWLSPLAHAHFTRSAPHADRLPTCASTNASTSHLTHSDDAVNYFGARVGDALPAHKREWRQ
jgi:hypothetical protein